METKKLANTIEAILFYKAEPVPKKTLAEQCGCALEVLEAALAQLQERLAGTALTLLSNDAEVSLVTAPEFDEQIESLRRSDMKRDIGKAGAETLAIIVYRGSITRGEIDRIRGVNSSYILRNLLVRGLISRTSSGARISYEATSDLLAHLGVSNKNQLPQYENILNQLDAFETEQVSKEDS